MRTYDFAPLTRSSIGFDRLFDLINTNAQRTTGQEPGFPPYDITRTGDDSFASRSLSPAIRLTKSPSPHSRIS